MTTSSQVRAGTGKRSRVGWMLAMFVVLTGVASAEISALPSGERSINNLAAFARVYGYVRFFYPSDDAATLDWLRFAAYEAERIAPLANDKELCGELSQVLSSVAPLAQCHLRSESSKPLAPIDKMTRTTFWQHQGVKMTDQSGPYIDRRVIAGAKGERAPLFEPVVTPPPIVREINEALVFEMPCALPIDAGNRTPKANSAEFQALLAALSAVDLGKGFDDWRIRCAAVIEVWTTFQHFHPYLSLTGVNWDAALEPALEDALHARDQNEMYLALMALIAKSQDGHGFVYGRPRDGWIPMRVDVVEGKIIVTGVGSGVALQKGDIIQQIDGVSAVDILSQRERVTSGGPALRRFRALNQFDEGPVGSQAVIEVLRNGSYSKVEYTRVPERRSYFFNSIGEFKHPPITEVKPGIFYINLYHLEVAAFEAELPKLAAARGIIFDWRFDGKALTDDNHPLSPAQHIIPHLIDSDVVASPMRIPLITEPDRRNWNYRETTWSVHPAQPRFKGRVIFINEPSVVSYGETCMAIISDYHLATLVGAPTAGTNGNVNFIPLPGGFRVMWTGMDVQKHDHTPFYGTGFGPDFPVTRTLSAVKEERDEYLDKAIEVIERNL